MRKRIRRRKNQKSKQIIIISTMCLFLCLCVGYAAFQTNITITAKGNITSMTDLYISSTGSDETGNGTPENPYATFDKAYSMAASTATIYVMDDVTVKSEVEFSNNKNITITSEAGETNSVLRGDNCTETLLHIDSGSLTLTNITFDGQNKDAWGPLIFAEYSTVNLYEGAVLQNNIDNVDLGGALATWHCTLVIDGAKITNNQALAEDGSGGGIAADYTNLTMESGEISNNYAADSGGGGIWFAFANEDYGLFTLNGGSIINNTAEKYTGGGVAVASANMIMNGGTISGNVVKNGGGGGIGVDINDSFTSNSLGTFIMNNGEITGNTATYNGGLVVGVISTYTINGGTIANNIPQE